MSDYISSNLTESEKDSWATPQWLFDALDQEFDFKMDAAASEQNHKVIHFMTIEDNAVAENSNWAASFKENSMPAIWVNPPYSRGMVKAFIDKAREQCTKHKLTIVLLVPATPDASWWPTDASEVRFITHGRVSFEHPTENKTVNGNTKGSAIIIFRHVDIGSPMVTRYVSRAKLMLQAQQKNKAVA